MTHKNTITSSNIILALVTVFFVVILSIFFINGVSVDINDERIKIKGIYGTEMPLDDIQEVQIIDKIPFLGTKINGIGLGFMNIGHFSFEGIGKVRLFEIKRGSGILIVGQKEKILLAFGEEKNKAIYEELMSAVEEKRRASAGH